MKEIDPGHCYKLDMLDSNGQFELVFVKRIGSKYPGNYGSPYKGTTTQEVMRAVAARLRYVNNQLPCAETEMAAELAEHIIVLLEQRNARIKQLELPHSIGQIISANTCKTCLHVGCIEHDSQSR